MTITYTPPIPAAKNRVLVECELPLRTVSEMNARGHWRRRHGRSKTQNQLCFIAVKLALPRAHKAPYRVLLTRQGPRRLDDDNLRSALKSCRDGIAQALGIDDGSDAALWEYSQEPGKSYGVKIQIQEGSL